MAGEKGRGITVLQVTFILCLIFLAEWFLFKTYVKREVAWSPFLNGDANWYLGHSYIVFDSLLRNHVIPREFFNDPSGIMTLLVSSTLYMFFGASRLAALSVNLVFYLFWQGFMFYLARYVTKSWFIAFAILGLCLSAAIPFQGNAVHPMLNIMEYQRDFAVFCLFGIFAGVVLLSDSFLKRKWSILGGLVAGFMVTLRYQALFHAVGIYLMVIAIYGVIYILRRRHFHLETNKLYARMVINGIVSFVSMAAFAFYPIYRTRYALYRHYFAGKLIGPRDDNLIKLYQQGVYDLLQRILYYPKMVLEHGLGSFFFYALLVALFIIVLMIIAILVRRLFKMSPSPAGFSESDIPKTSIHKYEYQLIPYSIFLFLSISVPLFLLTAYPVRSGNVGILITAPCIIAIFILFSKLWLRFSSLLGHKVLFFTKSILIVALLSIGTLNQLNAYTTVSVSSHNRSNYLEISRLYDKIIALSKEFAIESPTISVNFSENYVLGCCEAITAYCYEHSGELFRVRQKLGSDIGDRPHEKDALNLIRESDFVLLCTKEQPLESRNPLYCDPMSHGLANSPFSTSIRQIQPVLIEFTKNNFLSKGVYKIFNREVILYVNKNIGYRPIIRPSSQLNDTYSAKYILEESNAIWHSKSYPTYPQWVEFEYTSPVIINELTIRCQPGGSRRAPLEFYLQGEDTGGRWVNLLSVSNASFSQGHELKSWIVKNNTAFKCYRIYISKNAGAADFVTIAKVGFNYVINDSSK